MKDYDKAIGLIEPGDLVFTRIDNILFKKVAATSESWTSHVGMYIGEVDGVPSVAESKVPRSKITSLKDFVKRDGVKVIVSNKECGLTFHGRRKSKERKLFSSNKTIDVQSFFQINTEACEDCRVCVDNTGCPGLTQTEDAYGPKISIDPQICVSDSYCTKIKACPSFEEVKVFNYHPTKYLNEKVNLNTYPGNRLDKEFEV